MPDACHGTCAETFPWSHLLSPLCRYGIHQDDVFRAVNDTATPAVAAGKLISDGRVPKGGTTCQMHAVELVLKHSLGLIDRRKDGVISDSFQEGKDLRDLCRDLASKVMDKKAKGRFHEFEQLSMKTFQVKPIKLKTPNATRVAGDYILLVSLLRAKSLLQVLMGESSYTAVYKNYIIASEQWKTIAEFEAVMSHIHHLAMTSQGNEPGEIAFSWFELSMCWMTYKDKTHKRYNVVDVTQSWSPDTAFEKLPTVKMDYNMMSPLSQEFITRLNHEFGNYFPCPDTDQLIAMNLHPVVQRNTFE
jgi:hypothetical protein